MAFRDVVKKSILFGLGAVYLTKEEVEKFIKSLEKDGKITPTEGKKVVREVLNDAEKKWKKSGIKNKIEKFLKDEVAGKKTKAKKGAKKPVKKAKKAKSRRK